jgi:hypothetical protein
MTTSALLTPVFVQLGLIFCLLGLLGFVRGQAMKKGVVKPEAAIDNRAWPTAVRKVSNSFDSQFQVPVLFFALIPIILATQTVDSRFVIGAWVFVLSRIVHAVIHIGPNIVPLRFTAFFVGVLTLIFMWGLLASRVLAA